jgi:hypothetical protein
MAQKFPIIRTERTISGRGPSVRAALDVRTGGRELAEAVSGLGETLFKIGLRRQQMTDANSSAQAQKLRDLADEEYKQFKATNPQEMWQGFRKEQTERVGQEVGNLPFSPLALEEERIRSEMYSEVSTARALTEATFQLRKDTIDALTEDMVDSFRSGKPQRILDSTRRFIDNGANMGKDENEVLSDIKAAKTAGDKLKADDAISEVHAALEANNFGLARDLATSPSIPEPKQTTLRNAINSAENSVNTKLKEQRQAVIDKATSDTIREYFNGELTVATLNERHEKGLIKDSEFKFMMKGLQQGTREHSDITAAGNIRRAIVDFNMGVINREQMDKVVLENYTRLDGTDRSKVIADIEDVEAKIIASAKSNAYNEGVGLMSRQFVGIQTLEDLLTAFAGVGDEQMKKINKRWTAEVNNRDLYERAIDDRFKEMRKEGISDIAKYKAESLKILLQYQRRKAYGPEQFEVIIKTEQERIITPPKVLKPVSEMTTAEKQAELERIRELKRR